MPSSRDNGCGINTRPFGLKKIALELKNVRLARAECGRGAGLIHVKKGFYARSEGGGSGRLTRIWPTLELVALFSRCNLDAYKVGTAREAEVIILKDNDKRQIEYEDTPEICRMRQVALPPARGCHQ